MREGVQVMGFVMDAFSSFSLREAVLLAALVAMLGFLVMSAIRQWRSNKAALRLLEASEARFRAISEASPLGMAVFDAKTKEMIWSNERYGKLVQDGLSKVLGGKAWLEMALSESSPVVSFSRDFERDGKPAAARVHTARVKGGADMPMLVALVEDATQSRMARLSLESSQRKFEFVFKLSPLPMAILERQSGRILEVNDAFCVLFGRESKDWSGKTIAGSGLMGDGYDAALIWSEMVRLKGLRHREALMKSAVGAPLACEISASEMDWGESSCFALCAVDLTEQRKAEAQVMALNIELEERARVRGEQLARAREDLARQERLASLGALVAGVAHELNTPIGNALTVSTTLGNKTKGLAELAKSGKMRKQDLSGYLNEALDCSALIERNMSAAADFVSSFKQVSVDQMSSKRRRFDLAKCARDNCATLLPALRKSKVDIAISIPDGIEMDSYPGSLGQILVNLVNNSMLHAFDGKGGFIEVGGALGSNGERVELWVQDNGVGIAPEDEHRIFDPFYSTKFGQGGSGLGLSIVYNLTRDALGGKIELAESEQGARFVLSLPISAPMPKSPASH